MKMKAIHNHSRCRLVVRGGCVKLVKDNENESNSQHPHRADMPKTCCVKLVKDNENESNSQLIHDADALRVSCVKLVKDNENESNSQLNLT